MTGAANMVQFTPDAERRLGEYLRQVRTAAARSPGVSPDEIEADIREHIDNEFRDAIGPVTLALLEGVLVRLGPPAQWVSSSVAGTAPALGGSVRSLREWFRQTRRAVFDVLWRGPEDWRLPYLAFLVFALGAIIFPLFPLFLLVSYILARAGLAVAAEKGIALGARRWLVYPPMVVVSLPLLLGTMLWPVAAAGAGASHELEMAERFRDLIVVGPDGSLALAKPGVNDYQLSRLGVQRTRDGLVMPTAHRDYYVTLNRVLDAMPVPRPAAFPVAVVYAIAGALAAWWTILGALGWAYPGLPRAVFAPLASGWEARHGRRLFAVALVGLVLWVGFAYRLVPHAAV
jgi:hypothetical protein